MMRGGRPAFWASRSFPSLALLPLAGVFGALAALRCWLFRIGVLRGRRLPVPVVVVGNIAVGGSGKTPVVAWLAERLRIAGWVPGIVSRGYGGQVAGVALVDANSDPQLCGDEPVLLARTTGCPVAVGADRTAAAMALLEACPACTVIISDDGLQHHWLYRDVEIAVVDEAVLGNCRLLPAGPLREGLGRLAKVDLIVAHGQLSAALKQRLGDVPVVSMQLEGAWLYRIGDASQRCPLRDFRGRRVHVVAGIGRPERFFAQLRAHGLDVVPHPFPDHHRFCAADLDFAPGEPKILTAKDAVKCLAYAPADAWEFPVTALIEPGASELILEKLTHGRAPT